MIELLAVLFFFAVILLLVLAILLVSVRAVPLQTARLETQVAPPAEAEGARSARGPG